MLRPGEVRRGAERALRGFAGRRTHALFNLSLHPPSPSHPYHNTHTHTSCGTCAIATCLPCGAAVLHGRSTAAFLGSSSSPSSPSSPTPATPPWWAARPGLTLALLALGGWAARAPLVVHTEAACYPLDVHAPGIPAGLAAACARGRAAEAVTWWAAAVLTAVGLGLAAARRHAARRRHGLGGCQRAGRAGMAVLLLADVLAWACCPLCATCQEARTAAAGRCEGGVWREGEEEEGGEEGGGLPSPPPQPAPPFRRGV